ncbi:hypothetical protein PR048_018070 [Dryococelus australis]|uniref:Uncharacterized protein n=1 Tax=Dryococelus australis TaxID=614101 RepID=A0ABQ9HBM1_9NEOP|nr:hypothetical protein PR048_018070 [Dryococelus australis]
MSDLCAIYSQRMEALGVEVAGTHLTRLRDSLLKMNPQLEGWRSQNLPSKKMWPILNTRHRKEQETSVTTYLTLKIHAETLKKELVDLLHSLGICISYERFRIVHSDIANNLLAMYNAQKLVCPPDLTHDLFTTASVVNTDHNPLSDTAMSCFHGTAISVVQLPTQCKHGRARELTTPKTEKGIRRVQQLPPLYANVPPCFVSISRVSCRPPEDILSCEIPKDPDPVAQKWLDHLSVAMLPRVGMVLTQQTFVDEAQFLAMMLHTMNVVKAVVEHLNPGQIPVSVADAPLYALLKKIQFTMVDTHGEEKLLQWVVCTLNLLL